MLLWYAALFSKVQSFFGRAKISFCPPDMFGEHEHYAVVVIYYVAALHLLHICNGTPQDLETQLLAFIGGKSFSFFCIPALLELPAPVNVTLSLSHFSYILKWEHESGTPVEVYYNVTAATTRWVSYGCVM